MCVLLLLRKRPEAGFPFPPVQSWPSFASFLCPQQGARAPTAGDCTRSLQLVVAAAGKRLRDRYYQRADLLRWEFLCRLRAHAAGTDHKPLHATDPRSSGRRTFCDNYLRFDFNHTSLVYLRRSSSARYSTSGGVGRTTGGANLVFGGPGRSYVPGVGAVVTG